MSDDDRFVLLAEKLTSKKCTMCWIIQFQNVRNKNTNPYIEQIIVVFC